MLIIAVLLVKKRGYKLNAKYRFDRKKRDITKYKKLLSHIKMDKEKNKFYRHKSPIFLKHVDIEKVLVFKKISSGEKKYINTLLVTCIIIIKLSYCI